MPDVRGIGLELREEKERVTGRNRAELEPKPPLSLVSFSGEGSGVERHPLEPAGIEQENRVLTSCSAVMLKRA